MVNNKITQRLAKEYVTKGKFVSQIYSDFGIYVGNLLIIGKRAIDIRKERNHMFIILKSTGTKFVEVRYVGGNIAFGKYTKYMKLAE